MTKWEDYFEIKERFEEDGDIGSQYKWDIIVKETQQVVGSYNDYKYASKQARYKFRKIINRVEKILLG